VEVSIDLSEEGLTPLEIETFSGSAVVSVELGGRFEEEFPDVDFFLKNKTRKFPFKTPVRHAFRADKECTLETANLRAIVFSKHIKDRLVNARDRLLAEHSRQKRNLTEDSQYDKY